MHLQRKLATTVAGVLCATCLLSAVSASAQRKKKDKTPVPAAAPAKDSTARQMNMGPGGPPKAAPKKFAEVITPKAKADSGMFNVYKQDDKFFVEIPDQLLGRDILVVSRLSKAAAGMRAGMFGFGGDQINENVIRFEKGPNNRIFLKNISFAERSKDSTQPMFISVMNSNIQPISASFDIKAFSKGNNGSVLDFTDYINGDNDILFFDSGLKGQVKLGGVQPDKSYILDVKSYPGNMEIKTVKTYSKGDNANMVKKPVVEDIKLEDVKLPDDPKTPPPPPPPPAPPPPVKPSVQFTPPVIKKDEEVKAEEELVKIEEIKDKAVSTKTVEGDPNGIDPGLINDSKGTGVIDAPAPPPKDEIFTFVEQPPTFPGGEEALAKYLSNNIRYPPMATENGISGTVFVSFVVDSEGTIKDVKTVGAPKGGGLEEEAIRVVKKMPKWKPGKQNGRQVSVQFNLPIRFTLQE